MKIGGVAERTQRLNTATGVGGGGGVRVVVTRTEGHLSENQLGTVKTIELGVDLYEKAGAAKKGKS